MTTRLGFGSSGLMAGNIGKAESLALLEYAYDAGIRHFDVAPMYGFGSAEACMGEFLSHHRQDTTITTKFGLLPPKSKVLLNFARRVGKPILRQFPSLRKRVLRGTEAVVPSGTPVPFTAEQARNSLDTSLRRLGVDHVDVLLLHEASAQDLQDDNLLLFLERAKATGKIGSFGVGSEKSKILRLLQNRPAYCPVVQFDWSVIDENPPRTSAFQIRHRSLTDNYRSIHSALVRNAALCRVWSDATGRDLRSSCELAALMLKAALERNVDGIVLFSSKDLDHIARNAHVAADATMRRPALILHELMQTEGHQLHMLEDL